MRRKVEELEGAALDAAVAKADGHEVRQLDAGISAGQWQEKWPVGSWLWIRNPSSSWGDGGPIIEREKISTYFEETPTAAWHAEFEHAARADGVQITFAQGPTLLIAAMRAYVASKFGDEVDLPT